MVDKETFPGNQLYFGKFHPAFPPCFPPLSVRSSRHTPASMIHAWRAM